MLPGTSFSAYESVCNRLTLEDGLSIWAAHLKVEYESTSQEQVGLEGHQADQICLDYLYCLACGGCSLFRPRRSLVLFPECLKDRRTAKACTENIVMEAGDVR